MSGHVEVTRNDEVAFIALAMPPVNALGFEIRQSLHEAVSAAVADPTVKAIVLYGAGRLFSAGADIKDFARAGHAPTLPDLCKRINDSPKPVIAALHGAALGGALELALACHLRVGVSGLRMGLPEVKLGLLPGAGGTQRLPRLIGMAAALETITTGRDVMAPEALELGLLARLGDESPQDLGLQAARDVLSGVLDCGPTDALTVALDTAAVSAARAKHGRGLMAPMHAIAAIEAAVQPIDEGLARERALFMQLLASPERAGLVHAFLAERATAKFPEAGQKARDINNVSVVGGGTMGVGIATACLASGLPTILIEGQADRVEAARAGVEANLAGALKRGKLSEDQYAAALESLTCSDDLTILSDVDLVIEAIFEDMSAKAQLFSKLDQICKPGAILATNTSYLDVNEIAATVTRPQDVIGLHFFSPAHIMRLLEIVVADETAAEVVGTGLSLARRLRKVPVRSGVCDGFIGNRILSKYRKSVEYMALDGAGFDQIDAALEGFGFAMGPFAVGDLAGLDIARASRLRQAPTRPAEERYSRVADLICDQGWLGRKTGQGYYSYADKARVPNPGAQAIFEAERVRLKISPQDFSPQEIVDRAMAAMIIEACEILSEGIALRPIDIDAVELFGYGFPRHRGGPMHLADQIGAEELVVRIESYAVEDNYFWRVPHMLRDMAETGKSFAALNS